MKIIFIDIYIYISLFVTLDLLAMHVTLRTLKQIKANRNHVKAVKANTVWTSTNSKLITSICYV